MISIRAHHIGYPAMCMEEIYDSFEGVMPSNVHLVHPSILENKIYELELEWARKGTRTIARESKTMLNDYTGSRVLDPNLVEQYASRRTASMLQFALLNPHELIAITGMQDSMDCMACVSHKHCFNAIERTMDSRFIRQVFNRNCVAMYEVGKYKFPFAVIPALTIKEAWDGWETGEGSIALRQSAIPVANHPQNLFLEGFMNLY